MFYVIGIVGFLLCYFRSKFVWWLIPILILVCILFVFKLNESTGDVGPPFTISFMRPSIIIAMVFVLIMPAVGALLNYDRKVSGR